MKLRHSLIVLALISAPVYATHVCPTEHACTPATTPDPAPDPTPTPDPTPVVKPVLLFSDLDRGPLGAFVTVWGHRLAGGEYACDGEPCTLVRPPHDDPRLPAHGNHPQMQRFTVQIPGGAVGTIQISAVNGNSLPYAVTGGAVRVVAAGANINTAIVNAVPGDAILLRGGIYSDTAGGGFGNAVAQFRNKSDLALSCWPGETCVLKGHVTVAGTEASRITVGGLRLNGGGTGIAFKLNNGTKKNAWRIVGNHADGWGVPSGGSLTSFGGGGVENLHILGNSSNDTGVSGSNQAQNLYLTGNTKNENVRVAYNRLTNHAGGRLIQVYGHKAGESMTGLVIRNNDLSNAPGGSSDGILVGASDGPDKCWVKDVEITGNTITKVGRYGINLGKYCGVAAVVKDNIISNTGKAPINP